MDLAPVLLLSIIPVIASIATAAYGAYETSRSTVGGPPSWDRTLDPQGRTQKQYRQWANLPVGGQGGLRGMTAAHQTKFLSGNWGNGGGAPPLASTRPAVAPPGTTPGIIPGPAAPALFPPVVSGPTPQASLIPAVARGVASFVVGRAVGSRRPGGELVGVRGTDFQATGGYPVGPNLEDLLEQTYTPDLWARRLVRGIAVLAAPIKSGYSVPLVDMTGDIEGRIRATGGPIKKSAIILYGGGAAEEQALLLGGMLRGRKLTRTCEVVDEEGGGSDPVAGYVYERPKRRRGGIHVGAKQLRDYNRTAKKLKSLVKKVPPALRRKR
jgi:hypothetical protein